MKASTAIQTRPSVLGLPEEILIAIIECSTDPESPSDPYRIHALSTISRYFYNIIYNTKSLWSHLHMASSLEAFQTMLHRSGDAPLYIYSDQSFLRMSFGKRLRMLVGTTSRWRAVELWFESLTCDFRLVQTLLSQPFPILKKLKITADTFYGLGSGALLTGETPSLVNLSVNAPMFTWDDRIFQGLRVLRIVGSQKGLTFRNFVATLMASSNLEVLLFARTGIFEGDGEERPAAIRLPHLRTFALDNTPLDRTLLISNLLHLQGVRTIDLSHICHGMSSEMEAVIQNFAVCLNGTICETVSSGPLPRITIYSGHWWVEMHLIGSGPVERDWRFALGGGCAAMGLIRLNAFANGDLAKHTTKWIWNSNLRPRDVQKLWPFVSQLSALSTMLASDVGNDAALDMILNGLGTAQSYEASGVTWWPCQALQYLCIRARPKLLAHAIENRYGYNNSSAVPKPLPTPLQLLALVDHKSLEDVETDRIRNIVGDECFTLADSTFASTAELRSVSDDDPDSM
ncbi:hypothetical protein FRB90_008713 [Tulasnella sp. 427]|nr:hypothetical protein FRB90_008713 [Tulasnella sp. 427]